MRAQTAKLGFVVAIALSIVSTNAEAKIGGWVGKQWEGSKRAVGHGANEAKKLGGRVTEPVKHEIQRHPQIIVYAGIAALGAACIMTGGAACTVVVSAPAAP